MYDPTGSIIVELREDEGVSDWTSRIRGGEPAPGDAKDPGQWQRFIVVHKLDPGFIDPQVPVQWPRFAVNVYGTSRQDADEGAGLVTVALHHRGPRRGTGDGAIYASHHGGGAGVVLDPDTGQPTATVIVEVVATLAKGV